MTNCTDSAAARAPRLLAAAMLLTLGACTAPGSKRPVTTPTAPDVPPPAPTIDTNDADRRFQSALALMKARRFDEAQTAFLALSRDYPGLSGPLTDLGILYAQNRQPELAIASLTRAIAAKPDNAVAHNWLGTLHRERGDLLRAEECYRRAIAARSDYAAAHLNLGILYDVALHRPREALAAYRSYQAQAGSEDLLVAAWIRELEGRLRSAPASAPLNTAAAETQR